MKWQCLSTRSGCPHKMSEVKRSHVRIETPHQSQRSAHTLLCFSRDKFFPTSSAIIRALHVHQEKCTKLADVKRSLNEQNYEIDWDLDSMTIQSPSLPSMAHALLFILNCMDWFLFPMGELWLFSPLWLGLCCVCLQEELVCGDEGTFGKPCGQAPPVCYPEDNGIREVPSPEVLFQQLHGSCELDYLTCLLY